MGGSGIAGSLMQHYTENIPIFVRNGYDLPDFLDRNTLVYISSYSGNTEETIGLYNQAKKKGAKVVVSTSGGKLGEMTGDETRVIVPGGMPPRYSLGYQFFSMLKILDNSGLIPAQERHISETVKLLRRFNEKPCQAMAERINGRTPIILASDVYSSVVYRWQCEFNENSKILAFSHVFPEMNHNMINAFGSDGNFHAIMLLDDKDRPKIRKRMKITKDIIRRTVQVDDVDIKGDCLLARTFYAIHYGDWVSYKLAKLRGEDPMVVPVIEDFKKRLG